VSRARPILAISLIAIGLNPLFPAVRAWAVDSDEVRNSINQGNNYLNHNCFKQAIDEYEKCLDIDPDNGYAKSNIVLAHNNWGIFYFRQGKYELAKEQWQIALRLSPSDRKAKYNLDICQQALARMGKSQETGEQPNNEHPNNEDSELKEKPAESAIVILNQGKHAQTQDEKPAQTIKNQASQTQGAAGETANPIEASAHANKDGSPAASSETPLNKYYEFGTESGAKILPRKHDDGEAVPKVDESINRLETKIYGQPRSETSVLRRLERMELDSFGKINDAPITERISKLKRLFSIDD
jgi:tetratricopeptide (TPR) repeat protein